MVRFVNVGLIHRKVSEDFRRRPAQAIKQLHADGEVCRIDHADARAGDNLTDFFNTIVPARCADDQVASDGGAAPGVIDHRVRLREIQRDVNAVKPIAGNALAVPIFLDV